MFLFNSIANYSPIEACDFKDASDKGRRRRREYNCYLLYIELHYLAFTNAKTNGC